MHDKHKRAVIVNLLREYEATLRDVMEEVKKDYSGVISGTTSDAIALEYKYREGIKHGQDLLIAKMQSYVKAK